MDSQSQKYSSLIQKTDEKAIVEALLHDKQLFENPELVRKVAFNFSEVFPAELFDVTGEILDFIKSMDAQVGMDSQTKEVKGA
jgi:type III secretion system FlhB-like substrate exporter